MKLGIIRESRKGENRVAFTPETTQKAIEAGLEVILESGAGEKSGFTDTLYQKAGAQIFRSNKEVWQKADILCKIWSPDKKEEKFLSPDQIVIANFQVLAFPENKKSAAQTGITAFALDLLPRISRAQTMDILSSQSNLAGYKAVIDAFHFLKKAVPLMMTAAGTVTPAKVMIFGTGVAGLQAAATAHRMGAQVFATDVRKETAEQIASLGARFVPTEQINNILPSCDIAITTALSPNGKAPRLITTEQIKQMPKNAVLIDMASAFGGNIEGSIEGEIVFHDGRLLYGNSNFASEIPASASPLFAKNMLNFLKLIYTAETKTFNFNFDDELINKTCICLNGELR